MRPSAIYPSSRAPARIAVLIATTAILASAVASEVAAAPPPSAGPPAFVVSNGAGATAHILPSKDSMAQVRGVPASTVSLPAAPPIPLAYNGGPVMRAPVNYVIFWQPTGTTTFAPSYISGIQRYFQDIGGTPFYDVVTQFGDTSGTPVPNAASFGGMWTDTNGFPGGHTGSVASPVTDGDLQQAITNAIAANPTWQAPGLNTMFFVYLPQGIEQCFSSTSCFALTSDPAYVLQKDDYCAYHTYFNGNTIYASMPYTASSAVCGGFATYPNGRDLDLVLSPPRTRCSRRTPTRSSTPGLTRRGPRTATSAPTTTATSPRTA